MKKSNLRIKTTRNVAYWFCRHNHQDHYLGRVDRVTAEEARAKFDAITKLGWVPPSKQSSKESSNSPIDNGLKQSLITLSDLFALFHDWLKANKSKKTAIERVKHIRKFLAHHGDCKVSDLTLIQFEAFLATIANPLYRRHHAVSIRAMLRFGRKYGHIDKQCDPYQAHDLPKIPPKHLDESTLPTDDEIQRLFDYASPEMADLITFYLETGCRTSEAFAIAPKHVSLRSRSVTLADHKTGQSTGRLRTIILTPKALKIVERRMKGCKPDDTIFKTQTGKKWSLNNFLMAFGSLRSRARVRETITPYSFRHLWASDAVQTGVDLPTIARMMGSSVAVVERYYAHFRTEALQEAHAKIAALREKRNQMH